MRVFGLDIRRQKSSDVITRLPALGGGGWFGGILERFAGAWQRDIEVDHRTVLTYGTVWACVTLIAADIGKLWIKLVERDADGICTETENNAYSPVLRKPNHYQTRVKFFEHWVLSKLIHGNAYILKERNHRGGPSQGNVTALYVLDPSRVQVLVAPNGEVYYQLATDYLSGLREATVTVPASEIIHDLAVPLYHPLCGVSPLHACGLAAMQGLKIQQHSAKHFANGSQLSGILTAPGPISDDNAKSIRSNWEANYSGERNVGKIAVVGFGMKFEPLTMTAIDAQLIDQLKWTSENICATFHVPGYMVGIGPPPPYTDIQSINLQYYTQALQNPIENIELLLEEGLELTKPYGIEFDLDALARMDKKTQMDIATKAVSGGIDSPNEARAMFNRKPVKGGETPYLQAQNWPLSKLAERTVQDLPASPTTTPQATLPEKAVDRADDVVDILAKSDEWLTAELDREAA